MQVSSSALVSLDSFSFFILCFRKLANKPLTFYKTDMLKILFFFFKEPFKIYSSLENIFITNCHVEDQLYQIFFMFTIHLELWNIMLINVWDCAV